MSKRTPCKYTNEVVKHYHAGTLFDPGVSLFCTDPEQVKILVSKRRDFLREHGYFPVRDLEQWKLLHGDMTTEGLLFIPIKYCPRCRIIKPRVEFRKNIARLTGIESNCKECHRVRCRQYSYDRYNLFAPKVAEQRSYIKRLLAMSKRLLKNIV